MLFTKSCRWGSAAVEFVCREVAGRFQERVLGVGVRIGHRNHTAEQVLLDLLREPRKDQPGV